jgi:hypothetical protein
MSNTNRELKVKVLSLALAEAVRIRENEGIALDAAQQRYSVAVDVADNFTYLLALAMTEIED